MKTFSYVITDPEGIHARPAGEFVKTAKPFAASVQMIRNGKSVDAKKILALMGLGVKQGEEIQIQVEGPDEEEAAAVLERFLKERL